MSLLNVIEKEQATGQVAAIYEKMINAMGFVPNAFKIFSPSPFLLERQVSSLGYFMRHATLGGKLLAIMRMVVSVDAKCEYCVGVNTGILMHYGILPEQASEIRKNPATAPLDEKEMGMLLFVLKMVKDSISIEKSDVDMLKELGWNEAEILEGAYHGANAVASDMIFNAFKITPDV